MQIGITCTCEGAGEVVVVQSIRNNIAIPDTNAQYLKFDKKSFFTYDYLNSIITYVCGVLFVTLLTGIYLGQLADQKGEIVPRPIEPQQPVPRN